MKEGDWVITKANLGGNNIKAVSYFIEERDGFYVTTGAKKYTGFIFIVPKRNVIPMKSSVSNEDLDALINLALDLKDKEWFDELHKKLVKAKGR